MAHQQISRWMREKAEESINLVQHAALSTSKESTVPKPTITYSSTPFLPFEHIKKKEKIGMWVGPM